MEFLFLPLSSYISVCGQKATSSPFTSCPPPLPELDSRATDFTGFLELDMYDVYLLINLCSKNGMRGNCLGSAGSEGVDNIRFVSDNRNSYIHATTRMSIPWINAVVLSGLFGLLFSFCRLKNFSTVYWQISHRCRSVSGKNLNHTCRHLLSYS